MRYDQISDADKIAAAKKAVDKGVDAIQKLADKWGRHYSTVHYWRRKGEVRSRLVEERDGPIEPPIVESNGSPAATADDAFAIVAAVDTIEAALGPFHQAAQLKILAFVRARISGAK